MSWETVTMPVLLALAAALSSLIAWGTKKLVAYIDSKVTNDMFAGALKRMTEMASVVVLELQQTVVDRLKADGKWTAETASAVKKDALSKMKEYLGPKGLDMLKSALGVPTSTLDSLLGSYIEAQVKELRLDETP